MTEPGPQQAEFSLFQLLPNALTILAICAGLTAIRLGVQGDYVLSVLLIIGAGIIDGVDGRLARLLGSSSKMGAGLDSLAAFLNFGVAAPLTLYFWALQDMRGLGWISVLVFAVCCVIRLARFNVTAKSDEPRDSAYFQGVPSPAGALLVMLPMYLSFAIADRAVLPDTVICLYMIAVGLLLISRLPTWSFKTTKISRENVKFFLVGVAVVGAALFSFAWLTLIVLCLGYVAMVIWGWIAGPRPRRR